MNENERRRRRRMHWEKNEIKTFGPNDCALLRAGFINRRTNDDDHAIFTFVTINLVDYVPSFGRDA